ncbi:TonB-dependent receptor [Rubrivivax gelatinosus]|uniref:TonB-dependent receptor n=1 Tax=Rubrivivax gelatinosus TaxID=28068 RepID=UPI001906DD38|nr:TonB-dependent receptor [Rubrivivax gelatinosus]MBK1612365.1 TonB-dependent receptor [Rubrivivax gelatinosus]
MPAPLRPSALALAAFACLAAPAGAQNVSPPATERVERIEIIGISPLPGSGVARDRVPANVQTATDEDLRRSQSRNLADFLGTALPGVSANEIQGNPYQMDLNFRGFTASPLLGTPQGLSVYQDGVRVNEAFGDVVAWDLIPQAAIAQVTLLPGANPLFGLNTLGGALVLETKRGDTHPGTEASIEGGSFGRVEVEATHGRRLGDSGHLFLAADAMNEDGWRDHSPSRVRQFFAKAGATAGGLDWDLALTHADNTLIGNGLLPETLLAADREQIYTRPDRTSNKMTMLALNGKWDVSATQRIAATAYLRHADADTLNGDLNDDYDPPDVEETGVENRTSTRQRGSGLALQSTWALEKHRLSLGAAYDRARSRFRQTEAEGMLDATRAVVDAEEAEVDAWISGHTRSTSVWAADQIALAPTLQLTLSARWQNTQVKTVDRGRAELGLDTELDADARYRKLNPAAGLTWQASPALTVFGQLSQGTRAPSPIELGCSDPDNACVLPNALQSDPPLKQVVTRTAEAGVRGRSGGLRWNAALFASENRDDLLFISNGRAAGYFKNFGKTRRQGLELGASRSSGALSWQLAYNWLRATFESPACLVSEANSSAGTDPACPAEDEIAVRPGDRLPGLPAHQLKAALQWAPSQAWSLGAHWRALSSQTVRGNENGRHEAGDDYIGSGRLGGYALLDLTASWRVADGVEVFGRIANVFDREVASAGALGENAFDARGNLLAPDQWTNERFVGPGAPRAIWLGVRVDFDR